MNFSEPITTCGLTGLGLLVGNVIKLRISFCYQLLNWQSTAKSALKPLL